MDRFSHTFTGYPCNHDFYYVDRGHDISDTNSSEDTVHMLGPTMASMMTVSNIISQTFKCNQETFLDYSCKRCNTSMDVVGKKVA